MKDDTSVLTFELRRRRRKGAWPASPMIRTTGSRAKCLAGGCRLERRVRPHCAPLRNELDLNFPVVSGFGCDARHVEVT